MRGHLAAALSYRTPGAIGEALPGDWCFVQLWGNLGVISPTVECFLGIEPDAGRRTLRVVPNLPADWGFAEVKRLRVGATNVDIRVQRDHDTTTISINGAQDFELTLGVVLRTDETVEMFLVNDQPVAWQMEERNVGSCATCVVKGQANINVTVKTS